MGGEGGKGGKEQGWMKWSKQGSHTLPPLYMQGILWKLFWQCCQPENLLSPKIEVLDKNKIIYINGKSGTVY